MTPATKKKSKAKPSRSRASGSRGSKKKTAKAATKARSSSRIVAEASAGVPASMPPRPAKEIDPLKLEHGKATKRLANIYDLEREAESRKLVYENAKRSLRAARAEYERATDALENEIRQQRFGPGPLFNAEGTGPADPPPALPSISGSTAAPGSFRADHDGVGTSTVTAAELDDDDDDEEEDEEEEEDWREDRTDGEDDF